MALLCHCFVIVFCIVNLERCKILSVLKIVPVGILVMFKVQSLEFKVKKSSPCPLFPYAKALAQGGQKGSTKCRG